MQSDVDNEKKRGDAEIMSLAGAVCNGTASDAEIDRLDALLDGDAAAQGVYSGYMQLHAELFWHAQSGVPSHSVTRAGSAESKRWLTRTAWLVAALAAGLLFGLSLNSLGWFTSRDNGSVAGFDSKQLGDAVARVSGTRNCRWNDRVGDIGFGTRLRVGHELNLEEGLAEITFDNGVKVIAEGPVKLDVASANRFALHVGRMTASVPEGAEGFEVCMKGLTLVDRGTEFGVRADEGGGVEVHVFEGLLEGHLHDELGNTIQMVEWRTSEAVLVNVNGQQFAGTDPPSRFVRSLSSLVGPHDGIFASDDFDYPAGPLGGQNGGFGWGSPWSDVELSLHSGISEDEARNSNGVGVGSIAIEAIDGIGNHASLTGNFNRIRRILSTTYGGVFDNAGLVEFQDGARLVGKEGRSIYISFTQRISDTDRGFYGFELHRGDGNANRVICLGNGAAKSWHSGPVRTPNNKSGLTGWAVTSEFNGASEDVNHYYGDLGEETTETQFVVLKITFGDDHRDRFEVFLNPESLVDEAKCTPVVSGEGNFAFDRISLASFSERSGNKSFRVDQIRVGTDFLAVTDHQWDVKASLLD